MFARPSSAAECRNVRSPMPRTPIPDRRIRLGASGPYDPRMDSGRRANVVKLGAAVLVSAALVGASYLLPDDGFLGWLGDVLAFAGVSVAVGVPVAIWRLVAPARAARWDPDNKGQPIHLAALIVCWVGVGVSAWIVTQLEPPITFIDYVGSAFLWCAVAAMAVFVAMFTRQYLRDRRRSE